VTRWFEDVVPGERFALGAHTFTEAEIVGFARLYQPFVFHTDAAAARTSFFGGLVAADLHVASMGHRKMVDTLLAEAERLDALGEAPGESGPSPGLPRLDFPNPVRPGDTISYTLAVSGKRQSKSLPGWGLLFNVLTGVNQHGAPVYLGEVIGFSRLRP